MHLVSIIGVFNTQIPKMDYSGNVNLCFSFMMLLKIIEIKGNNGRK